jgi:plastocyanin
MMVDVILATNRVSGSAVTTSAWQTLSVLPGRSTRARADNFSFHSPEVRIPRGGKVTRVNADDVPHLIASADGSFRPSSALDTNDQYTLTLDRAGSYPYYCTLHPRMTGMVIVE